MKKLFYFLMFFFAINLTALGQNVIQKQDGNYVAVKSVRKSEPPTNTGKTYTDSKGKVWPVHVTKSGRLVVIRKSAKTGEEYYQYLKL